MSALDARDLAFVEAYLATGSATEAARKSGHPPRTAKRLLERPDIAAEIARRQASGDSGKPAGEVSLQSLIGDAQRALKVAEESGNASAMVAATTLLARLTGRMDGAAPKLDEAEVEPVNMRDAARAICEILRGGLLEAGSIKIERPGKTLVEVDSVLVDTVGGTRATTLGEHLDARAEVSEADGVFSNGARIAFEETKPPLEVDRHGRSKPVTGRPITQFAIYQGKLCRGHRLTREEAVSFAKALPPITE